jgi:hypothetical protein
MCRLSESPAALRRYACGGQECGRVSSQAQVSIDELAVLAKEHERLEDLGLSLAEAKALLLEVQRHVLGRQIVVFLASRRPCPT